MDPRNRELAKVLVNYSTKIQKGEKVLIECVGFKPAELIEEIVREVFNAGGIPFYQIMDEKTNRLLLDNGTADMWKIYCKVELERMKSVDAYIAVRGQENVFQNAGISSEKMNYYRKYYVQPVHIEERVEKKKWVILRYPAPSFAQSAQMPDNEFEDFYFKVCTLDYSRLSKAMDSLEDILKKTKEIRLVGEGTDITIGIEGMNWIKCDGEKNIPDGEIYSAPVRDKVNGRITYNTKALFEGKMYKGIWFEVKDGKIINEGCEVGDNTALKKILDIDEGARYFGEFAFGVNPYIRKEILDTLFDEKIYGSNHLTPGNAYKDAFNGNKSALHWDLVSIGLDVYADGKLIRKGTEFVIDELKDLDAGNF